MSRILIVEKTGVIKESSIKSFVEADLYKKAGFKTNEGFEQVHQWNIDGNTVSLYGKSSGRAGQENKYDFPPPVDKILFFGSCILTSDSGSLKKAQWETIYEKLFGGFEDVDDDDSEISEDDDDELDLPRTKSGYVKDGFIVDEDEDEDEDDDEDDDDDVDELDIDVDVDVDDEEPKSKTKSKTKPKAKVVKNPKKAKQTVFGKIDTFDVMKDENLFLDCTTELEEEEYE